MTRGELARLLDELPEHWRLFHALLAETGLRVSEALGVDWSDVEFGGVPRLRVRRQFYRGTLKRLKSRNGRRDLPLSAALARRLWTVRPADGAGPVFATRNGTRYLDRNVRRVLDKATERAGLEWVSFHTFRHTCASMLFDSGRNIRQVCDWLGHADPAFHAADVRAPDGRRARRAARLGDGAEGGPSTRPGGAGGGLGGSAAHPTAGSALRLPADSTPRSPRGLLARVSDVRAASRLDPLVQARA